MNLVAPVTVLAVVFDLCVKCRGPGFSRFRNRWWKLVRFRTVRHDRQSEP